MNNGRVKRTISEVIRASNETYDIQETEHYENQMACMFASPIMFFGAIVNFVLGYLILHEDLRFVAIKSCIFLVLGILFEASRRVQVKVEIVTYIISCLFSFWFLFILHCFYPVIGPAIWTIAAIQMALAMVRIRKQVSIIIGIVTISSSIYVLFNI